MKNRYVNELVSIITPVYNAELLLPETIESVIRQTYTNWELILVDDCSNDKSVDIIKKYCDLDKRIKYFKLESNSGSAVARNKAIELSRGRFIAFLDSDDLWKSNKLELQLEYMINNGYQFTFTSYEVINQNGTRKNKIIRVPNKINYNGLLKNTIIGCLTVILDRNLLGDISMPNIRRGQDTACWLKILKKIDYAYGLDINLSEYRIVENSLSSSKIKSLKRTWNIYRNVENLSFIKSCYVFINYIFNSIKKRI